MGERKERDNEEKEVITGKRKAKRRNGERGKKKELEYMKVREKAEAEDQRCEEENEWARERPR